MIDAMHRGGSSGGDDGEERPGLATVTPIRPGIQLADTTSFGNSAFDLLDPAPGDAPPDEADTWGAHPTRRMRVDDAGTSSTFTADDTTTFGGSAGDGCAIDDDAAANTMLADDNHVHNELDHDDSHAASWRAPAAARGRRWGIVAVSLAAVLGGGAAVLNTGGHASGARRASARVAQRPATSATATLAHKPTASHRPTSPHAARPHRRSQGQQHRHSGSRAHVAAASHRSTAVARPTVNSAASSTPAAVSRDSQTPAAAPSVRPHPSPATTAPAAPTHTSSSSSASSSSSMSSRPKFGQQGVLGPGRSPDS
jgi:hypothetical protein